MVDLIFEKENILNRGGATFVVNNTQIYHSVLGSSETS